jgi:hypothetical protein
MVKRIRLTGGCATEGVQRRPVRLMSGVMPGGRVEASSIAAVWVRLPSEKHCSAGLDLKAFNRLLGQRSDDLVNMVAISAGRFQSQIGRVRQDNPKGGHCTKVLLTVRHLEHCQNSGHQ